jgi:hypothetical protein
MELYRRDYNALAQHRRNSHFDMAHFRTLYGEKELTIDNIAEKVIPVSSRTELGLHQLWFLSRNDSSLQSGKLGVYREKEWLLLYEEPQVHQAYKKHLAQEVAAYADVFGESTPFAFLGRLNFTSGARLSTFVGSYFSADTVNYYTFFVFPATHATNKLERYFEFIYNTVQWRIDTIYRNLLPGVVVCTCKEVPISVKPDQNHDLKEDVDTEHTIRDYVVKVSGDTRILLDDFETYQWSVEDKLTGDKMQIPLSATSGEKCEVQVFADRLRIIGHKLGTETITLFNTEHSISHSFKVEVVQLW